MEEDKAAAYYEELTRKGEGAARFKQGLGFSSSSSSKTSSSDTITPKVGPTLPSSSSSFLSSFVRASSPNKIDKQIQLENIQNKLKKKESVVDSRVSRTRRSRSRARDKGRSEGRRRSRSRSYSRERHDRRSRSRSCSPREPRRSEKNRNEGKRNDKERNYSRLIKGYAEMTPAERVKAKMKLQLSQTAEKDSDKGMGAGWERFEFNKDAPLDDEEIEVAEDDALVVKKMGQSFRFSAVEARREEQIKVAHDQAMFGAPVAQPSIYTDTESSIEDDRTDNKGDKKRISDRGPDTNLISEKVLAKQQGSWRDRARKLKDG